MKRPVVIGKRVEILREEKGLEKGQLAYKVGTSPVHIGRIERNERPGVSAVLIASIAVVLDTTVEYLTGLTDDPRPIALHKRLSNSDRFTRDAVQLLNQLPDYKRPEVLEYLRIAVEYADGRIASAGAKDGPVQPSIIGDDEEEQRLAEAQDIFVSLSEEVQQEFFDWWDSTKKSDRAA